MKKGKKIKLDINKNYTTNIGCIDNKGLKTVYLNLSAWCEPIQTEIISYNQIIRNLNGKIKIELYNYLRFNDFKNLIKKDRSIIDLDIKESGVKYGKKSFCDLEITLFLNQLESIQLYSLKYGINKIINHLIENVFEKNEYFKFSKTKK